MTPPRVEVEWVDIEDDPRWQSIDDAAARECPICHTAGWLIADRPDTVVVAPSINCTDCSTTTIPRGCIRAIRLLKRAGIYKGGKHDGNRD